MIGAVLWDNDGVLVETEGLFYQATREAFAAAGLSLSPGTWMRLYLEEGHRSREIALRLGMPAGEADTLIRSRDDLFRHRLARGVSVRPGVHETLEALRGRVRLALVTGSSRRHLLLVHRFTGLLPFFECVVTREDSDRAKPAPDPYLVALARLGLPPESCLAVEDSARGAASAASAGIRCVVVPHELTDREACAGAVRFEAEIAGVARLVAELDAPTGRPPEKGGKEESAWRR
jgi:HAD superfamily hydrolase (TIGR01509 family)